MLTRSLFTSVKEAEQLETAVLVKKSRLIKKNRN
jgi:hypothetical protein